MHTCVSLGNVVAQNSQFSQVSRETQSLCRNLFRSIPIVVLILHNCGWRFRYVESVSLLSRCLDWAVQCFRSRLCHRASLFLSCMVSFNWFLSKSSVPKDNISCVSFFTVPTAFFVTSWLSLDSCLGGELPFRYFGCGDGLRLILSPFTPFLTFPAIAPFVLHE